MVNGTTLPVPSLSGAAYVLGEVEQEVAGLEGLAAKAASFRMALDSKLWGWGRFRRTARSIEELAIDTGLRTLQTAACAASDVDAVIFCSTRIPGGPDDHREFIQTIFTGLGISNVCFVGVTLNRCANMLVALRIAQALVRSESYRNVMVITADRIDDEAIRMERFAVFSDGAASCLVSANGGGYELVDSMTAQDMASAGWQNEISATLARKVNDTIFERRNMSTSDVGRLLHANLYKPVVVMKERQAGFSMGQLFLGNIERFGHCFAADPIINFVDHEADAGLRPGQHCLLASSVPGLRAAVLLRKH